MQTDAWREIKRARAFGDALARALDGRGRTIDDAWHMDRMLLEAWAGNREDLAVRALQEAAPVIDDVTRAWR
jgi:hypothetical protein